MAAEIHVNDALLIKATMRDQDENLLTDIASATTLELWLVRPDNEVLTKTASLYTDGSDGIIKYQCTNSDLSLAGTWSIQGFAVINSGYYHSDIQTMTVYRNLK